VRVLKYLPSAIAIAWTVGTPAFAADESALPSLLPITESAAPLPPSLRGLDAYEVTGSAPPPLAPAPTFADRFGLLPGYQSVGPANFMNWRGFYVGGQFGYSDGSADFSKSTQAPIAYSLRELTLENEFAPSNWPVLGTANHGAAGFGGFVGYNTQFEQFVLGVEANYDQASLSFYAPNSPIGRITPADSGGNNYLVTITGSGTITDLNFGTLRARAGWALGNFLPYAFVGVAIGRANVNITETTSGQQNPPASGSCSSGSTPPCIAFSATGTAGTNSEWLYGGTIGAGLDVALTPNIFLRAEYEYIQFAPVASTIVSINTGRVGAGIKF
jgi:opacity protein-like surface antigen